MMGTKRTRVGAINIKLRHSSHVTATATVYNSSPLCNPIVPCILQRRSLHGDRSGCSPYLGITRLQLAGEAKSAVPDAGTCWTQKTNSEVCVWHNRCCSWVPRVADYLNLRSFCAGGQKIQEEIVGLDLLGSHELKAVLCIIHCRRNW